MCITRIRGGFIFSGERLEMIKDFSEVLVESSAFPVGLVSEKSAREKAGCGRPPYWEMVFWWTRKPLAGARAIIAGALVPSNVSVSEFCRVLRLNEGSPHRHNPVFSEKWREWFKGKSLLDPFAGFGSVPLEALRLGLSEVVAVELLPACYVFLKAILEYPLKYGKKLVEDVEKWGNWVTEQLRQDPVIQQLYEPDVAVYIGSWKIRCPHCNKWTPLIGNWWLARVSRSGGGEKRYTRLAWMKPKIKDDKVFVEVIDLNKVMRNADFVGVKVDTRRGLVTFPNGKMFEVPKPNVDSRKETVVCLHCNNTLHLIDPQTEKHYTDASKLDKKIKSELVGYVKYALKNYFSGDFRLAKPTLLIKVKKINGNFVFEPCTEEEQKKLELAKQEMEKLIQQKDPDIPTEPLAPYGTQAIGGYLQPINYDINDWYKIFNFRQQFCLVKVTKMIREAGKLIQMEKLKEGLSLEEARQYAEAVTTCLATSLVKYVDYNSTCTRWHPVLLIVANTISLRGIAMVWNWTDLNPFVRFTGSWTRNVETVVKSLNYLVRALRKSTNDDSLFGHLGDKSKLNDKVRVLLDDATLLTKLNPSKFELVITDPPYYADVPYAELSDFYYVWLKRALSDVNDTRLVPRFLPEAFFKRVGAKQVEIRTQWEEFAKREISLNPPRLGPNADMAMGERHFLNLLTQSFVTTRNHLKDDGLLITYYAHTSPDAWIALLEAGWKGGGFRVVNAFPIATESLQRVTARGKYALDTSIVVVWRKGSSGSHSVEELYDEALRHARLVALELIKAGRMGSDLFVGTMASILSLFTHYKSLYSPMGVLDVKSLVTDYVYPATAKALAMALGEFAGTPGEVKRPESLFYLITKALFPKPPRAKRKLDRSNTALLSIGTKADLDTLETLTILHKEKEKFYLEEPATADRKGFEELLQRKGINPAKPTIESPIDALHLLEYYTLTLPLEPFLTRFSQLREEYSSEVEEAINIAAILAKTIPATDPEKKACQEIIARIKGEKLA
jgi:putative DNA methylase